TLALLSSCKPPLVNRLTLSPVGALRHRLQESKTASPPPRWGVKIRPRLVSASRKWKGASATIRIPVSVTSLFPKILGTRVASAYSVENHFARGEIFMTMPNSHSVASQSVDRATFENLYAGKAPWDIGRPQGPFVAVADRVVSPVLDAGCGTGETALFL